MLNKSQVNSLEKKVLIKKIIWSLWDWSGMNRIGVFSLNRSYLRKVPVWNIRPFSIRSSSGTFRLRASQCDDIYAIYATTLLKEFRNGWRKQNKLTFK